VKAAAIISLNSECISVWIFISTHLSGNCANHILLQYGFLGWHIKIRKRFKDMTIARYQLPLIDVSLQK
jgi:hypothetical protein